MRGSEREKVGGGFRRKADKAEGSNAWLTTKGELPQNKTGRYYLESRQDSEKGKVWVSTSRRDGNPKRARREKVWGKKKKKSLG